jgi:hypothetical protein
MNDSSTKVTIWFKIVTIILLLWNIMGLASFYYHVFISEEALAALPENESALYREYPLWTSIVFAIAVFGGTAGTLGLILKKLWAKPLLVISLIAIIIQMSHSLFLYKFN